MRSPDEIGFEYLGKIIERPAPTPEQMTELEDWVGVPLPEDYKAFMALQNGGVPKKSFVPTDDGGYRIETFNYIGSGDEDNYDVVRASKRPSDDLDEQVLAIAPDGSGDTLILRHGDGGWAVEWWRHDEAGTERMAASFTELLDKLEDPPEY